MKHYTSPRIQRAQLFLMKVSSYLEIACALVLIVAICIAFIPVPQNLYSLYLDNGFDLSDFMKKSFDLVIGVELLKMFCRHDIDSIVEVLLFSVARQMVIDHLAIKEAFIGCVAVAILFAVRRFLFVPILDNPDEQERKLEKDQYIKERIADAIAAYKKEMGAASLRERAESSINTAAADQLNEKEGSEYRKFSSARFLSFFCMMPSGSFPARPFFSCVLPTSTVRSAASPFRRTYAVPEAPLRSLLSSARISAASHQNLF